MTCVNDKPIYQRTRNGPLREVESWSNRSGQPVANLVCGHRVWGPPEPLYLHRRPPSNVKRRPEPTRMRCAACNEVTPCA